MSKPVIDMKQYHLPHINEKWKQHRVYPIFEDMIYGNIRSYNFDEIKVKACIDFLAIKFKTDKPQLYTHIKKYMTEKTKQAHYIEPIGISLEQAQSTTVSEFKIVLHDVKSYRDLERRLDYLKYYNKSLNIYDLEVLELETALDFYGADPKILVALLKSIRLKGEITNVRFFGKGQSNSYFLNVYDGRKVKRWIEPNSADIYKYLDKGGCPEGSNGNFAINDKSDGRYFHGYHKKVDKNKLLPESQHRPRFEIKLQGHYLNGITLGTLSEALKRSSKELSFTAFKITATPRDFISTLEVKPYGLEYSSYKTKTNLPSYIESYSELNRIKLDAFRNLIKAFNSTKVMKLSCVQKS